MANRKIADDLIRNAAFVNGEWQESTRLGTYTLRNPATDEVIAELPRFHAAETATAIDAAHNAYPAWRRRSGKERAQILRRWFDLITEHTDALATIIVMEEGKPFAEAKGEIAYAASFIEWFAEEAKRVCGEIVASPDPRRRILVLKEPIGVCAAITPWNFPAAMITRKAGPALAAGCTMVVKPAEQTPLTALALAELAMRAGVPKGVFNVITGGAEDAAAIGAELTGNPLVRKVTFTGSTEVGRLLIAQSARTVKKTSMELGGNAPFIVFDDADLDAAVDGLIACKFRNTGQACISANRVLAQSGIYDRFAAAVSQRVQALLIGNGFAPGVQQGPLIDDRAVTKVEAHIADAISQGASILTGGKRHSLGGRFFEPTVLTGVTSAMRVCREETFGPVVPMVRFADEAEAMRIANNTEFGLAAYLYTRDAERIWRVATNLETGMLGINTGLISNEAAPFGGVKQSGLGREGSHHGIEEYLELKYLAWEGVGEASSVG